MLELKNLYKKYQRKDTWAVNNVNLHVSKGELLALVGESGSGKTTLLRLIAGFEIPEQGFIAISGNTVFDQGIYVQPEKRRIGMVFQDYALFPHLSIKDNILFGLKGTDKKQKNLRLQELLKLVGLETQTHKYPHELSGGQQQRVALARALAPGPDILLLDEPFSSLDEVLKEQMRREMRRIIKVSGITAVFVTHDTRDALTTADRIVILKEGIIHQAGSPEELYEQPANPYVANFFGQVNLLPATRRASAYHTAIGSIPAPAEAPDSETVQLCIRPEHIEVCSEREAHFSGNITEMMYLGSYLRVRLRVKDEILLLHLPVDLQFNTSKPLYCRVNIKLVRVLPLNKA
ncbi:ABC transporter [Flammeovirgaceae bacterium 311]|nr:ABC transporter [Flammeovirgaceae bacterium 311]